MARTDTMMPGQYADLVRRIVAWVEERQRAGITTQYQEIAYKFSLTQREIDDICGDSTAYGDRLMPLALPDQTPRGQTHVEVLSSN